MITNEIFTIEKTDLNFSRFKNEKPQIVNRDVAVLVLPSFSEKDAFHNGTIELFAFLRKEIGDNEVELFASDDEYKELALHSKAYWLGVFLVTQIAVPIFTDVMSDYIKNTLQAKNGDEIDINIIVERKNDSNIKVTYRGDAKHINSVLDKVNSLSRDKEIDEPK